MTDRQQAATAAAWTGMVGAPVNLVSEARCNAAEDDSSLGGEFFQAVKERRGAVPGCGG